MFVLFLSCFEGLHATGPQAGICKSVLWALFHSTHFNFLPPPKENGGEPWPSCRHFYFVGESNKLHNVDP